MPEFRFSNGVLLARAVEVLLPLAKEGIINYSPEGLSLVVSEPSGLLKAALEIKSSGFTIFDCDVKSSASVNLEELYKELNRSTGEDALTIFGGDGDYIRFQYHSTRIEERFYAESEMILTQIYNKNLDVNELQYKYEMGVSLFSEGFRNLITHLQQFGSRVFMTVKKSQVTFEVEGEETNLSTLTKQYRITSQIAEDDFLCSIFSLNHMRSLQNASLLSRYVCIFSSDTFNCMLNYRIGEGYSWVLVDAFKIDHQPLLMMGFLVLGTLTLFLLFTSINLPLRAEPVRLRTQNFSGLVALSLLASIIFPPSLIILFPWHEKLYNLFKRYLYWSHQTLQSIPTLIIICITQHQENPEASPAEVEVELIEIQDSALVNANGNQLADSWSNGAVQIDHLV